MFGIRTLVAAQKHKRHYNSQSMSGKTLATEQRNYFNEPPNLGDAEKKTKPFSENHVGVVWKPPRRTVARTSSEQGATERNTSSKDGVC